MNLLVLPWEGGTINCCLGRKKGIFIEVQVVAGERGGMWLLAAASVHLREVTSCSSTFFIKKPTNATVSSLSLVELGTFYSTFVLLKAIYQ